MNFWPIPLPLRAFALLACVTSGFYTFPAQAQDAKSLQLRALASTCANCHGTDGAAVQGEAMVPLKGLSKEYIVNQMQAFKEGKRTATVMHQISKGYSAIQIDQIASYFASLK